MKRTLLVKRTLLAFAALVSVAVADISLTWDASSSPDVVYRVHLGQNPGGPYPEVIDVSAAEGLTKTIPSSSDTRYAVVTAVDAYGQESDPSNEVVVPGIPTSPQNLNITITITIEGAAGGTASP